MCGVDGKTKEGSLLTTLLTTATSTSAGISFIFVFILRNTSYGLCGFLYNFISNQKLGSSENMQVEDQSVGDSWRRIRLL